MAYNQPVNINTLVSIVLEEIVHNLLLDTYLSGTENSCIATSSKTPKTNNASQFIVHKIAFSYDVHLFCFISLLINKTSYGNYVNNNAKHDL